MRRGNRAVTRSRRQTRARQESNHERADRVSADSACKYDSIFAMENPEARIPSPEARSPDPESRIPNPEARIPKPEARSPDPESRIPNRESRIPSVVIVGGGFGGLNAARALAGANVGVTLLDRHNYHLFQPLLYQVATAALSPGDIASPIRWILRHQANVEVQLADVRSIDPVRRIVETDRDPVAYDFLIVATGAAHAYFGHPEWASRAPGLKTLDDALEMRRRVLLSFEAAERERDPDRRLRLLTFVIVGGGPTG